MKDNLENIFKNSLEDYEVPYDPKAWDAVNAQLNANAVSGSSVLSNAFKWVLSIVLIGAVVTGTYFLWNNNKTEVQTSQSSINPKDNVDERIHNESSDNNSGKIIDTELQEEVEVEEAIKGSQEKGSLPVADKPQKVLSSDEKIEVNNTEVIEVLDSDDSFITDENKPKFSVEYAVGDISRNTVCPGETILISNTTKRDKVRFLYNEEWILLNPGKSFVFAPEESTRIDFVNDRGVRLETKEIRVHEVIAPSFNFEANVFEGGLPVVIAEAYGDYSSYTWVFDGEKTREGAEVKHSFFDKGEYEVQLKVIDRNGCEATASQTVHIRDKYNLMAVDAFKPNGSDRRNRTFMPYFLMERNVRFQLTIIDPVDNSIVFTSTDAADAWDGTDQRTGKMTPSNKPYIWKVQVFNPVENERPVYAGTIVHN